MDGHAACRRSSRTPGLRPEAVELVFTGADHGIQGDVEQDYQWGFSLADIVRDDVLLAYEVNGQPLPPQHGFPVRLLVPDWYGMCSVKWLRRITAVAEPSTASSSPRTSSVRSRTARGRG